MDVPVGVNLSGVSDDTSPMDEDPPSRTPSPTQPKSEPTSSAPAESWFPLEPPEKGLARAQKNHGGLAAESLDWEKALQHYNKALDYDPTDIGCLNCIARVYIAQGEDTKFIGQCEKIVEIGRENGADCKVIGRALSWIGLLNMKQKNWKIAKTYLEKSLSEFESPELKTKLSELEEKIKEEERKAYIDPTKAEEAKETGNELFKNGNYREAVKYYSEAIKRNPDDPKYYSKRAACYTKLAAFDLGLKDCDDCTRLDPKCIKGWIRKGKILQEMQQQSKAIAAYQKALDIDTINQEALDGYKSCSVAVNSNPEEVRKHAMGDPEVQAITQP